MKEAYLITLILLINTKFIFTKELLLKHLITFEEKFISLNDGSTLNSFKFNSDENRWGDNNKLKLKLLLYLFS